MHCGNKKIGLCRECYLLGCPVSGDHSSVTFTGQGSLLTLPEAPEVGGSLPVRYCCTLGCLLFSRAMNWGLEEMGSPARSEEDSG